MPRWLVWTISIIGFAIIARWTLDSAMALAGSPIRYPDWFRASQDYVVMIIAAVIVGVIVYYEGWNRAGFAGSPALNVRAGLQGSSVILAIGGLAYSGMLLLIVGAVATGILPDGKLADGVRNQPPTVYQHILWSVSAGWTEEIILISLMFFLFKRSGWTVGGKEFGMTGWATAITIAVRLSYHTYHGLMVLPVALTGWLFVRLYRQHNSVVPVIMAHIIWDLSGLANDEITDRVIFVTVLLIASEVLTKGADGFSALGLGVSLFRDKRWPGFYWACWRWEKDPAFLPPKTKRKDRKLRSVERDHVGLNTADT
jgi:Type II CAAX prenyl endopeptidase Rce1-like